MDIMGWLNAAGKVILPNPKDAPRRYVVAAGVVIYYLAKAYVSITPSPLDDHIPDAVRDTVVQVFTGGNDSAEKGANSETDYDVAEGSYGETA